MLAKTLKSLPQASIERKDRLWKQNTWGMDELALKQYRLLGRLKEAALTLAEDRLPGVAPVGAVRKLKDFHSLPSKAFLFRLYLVPARLQDHRLVIRELEPYERLSYQAFFFDLMGSKPRIDGNRVWFGVHVPLTNDAGIAKLEESIEMVQNGHLV